MSEQDSHMQEAPRPTRRSALKALAAAAPLAAGFPYISKGVAAQTLKFWQFYGPGGGVASQSTIGSKTRSKAWNDSHEVRRSSWSTCPNNAYMDGTKLPTAFASGAGPDHFHHQPRRLSCAITMAACCSTSPRSWKQAAQRRFLCQA